MILLIDATATGADGSIASASVEVTVNVPGETAPAADRREPGLFDRMRQKWGRP